MAVQTESQVYLEKGSQVNMHDGSQPGYPLHDSVKHRLHQQYVDFYNKYVINARPAHLQPISESRKTSVVFGSSPNLPVGHTEDFFVRRQFTPGPEVRVRCFVPSGEPPRAGWPVMLYIHGGGWVLGNIDSENHICTNLCVRSKCIVLSPEYRLAPEDPFPAALNDCWETLQWIFGADSKTVRMDVTKVAVGGCSSGANLAAAIVNKSVLTEGHPKIVAQLLAVPALDNTASPCNNPSWKENEFTAALPAAKMLWYRRHYLPNLQDRDHPDASPFLFVASAFAQGTSPSTSLPQNPTQWNAVASIPPTTIIAADLCVLRQEGEDYGNMLRKAGVPTSVHVMEGMPHPFIALDNVLDDGKRGITLLCDALTKAVWQ